MNQKSAKDRAAILRLLVEGNSFRATARITGFSINTVSKLFQQAGAACEVYQHEVFIDLPCTRMEVDEIWSFALRKDKNRKPGEDGGSVWTWTSICPDTKLAPVWAIGKRDSATAFAFMRDLASRFEHRIQLTSDGLTKYREAVYEAFGRHIDFAMLVKIYEDAPRQRYVGATKQVVFGNPNLDYVSTSMVERQNLTMRTSIKRFARKTNAHSKKIECHGYAVALHFMYYNFCRIHTTLRVTPAMAAGISDHVWELEDIVRLIP